MMIIISQIIILIFFIYLFIYSNIFQQDNLISMICNVFEQILHVYFYIFWYLIIYGKKSNSSDIYSANDYMYLVAIQVALTEATHTSIKQTIQQTDRDTNRQTDIYTNK